MGLHPRTNSGKVSTLVPAGWPDPQIRAQRDLVGQRKVEKRHPFLFSLFLVAMASNPLAFKEMEHIFQRKVESSESGTV